MSNDLIFYLITWLVVVLYVGGAWWAAKRFFTEPLRTTFVALLSLQAIIAILYMLSFDPHVSIWWNWFFDIHTEFNLEAIFSTAQLMMVVAVAVANLVFASPRPPQKIFWVIITLGFIFLALDEYFSIHELDIGLGSFREIYIAGGLLVGGICALCWWFGFDRDWRFIILFGLGGAIMVGGGIAFEPAFLWPVICKVAGDVCVKYNTYGESMETFGEALVLCAAMLQLQKQATPTQAQQANRGAWLTGAASVLAMIVYLWVSPAIEVRTLATHVNVTATDGSLSLLGYTLSPTSLHGDHKVNATLYWEAHQPVEINYTISAHLVTVPDAVSVAQSDWVSSTELNNYPSVGWLPGVPVRMNLSLDLPPDLPTSQSYSLIVRLWTTSGASIPLTTADRQLLATDTVILQNIAAIADTPPPAPALTSNYTFNDALLLYGYDLPQQAQAGQPFTVTFNWRKQARVNDNLSQFVHLINPQAPPVSFDKQPFDGKFPVSDWPLNTPLLDRWEQTLPASVPAGNYKIYTGLYTWPSLARLPVIDIDGQTVTDGEVLLGTLTIVP